MKSLISLVVLFVALLVGAQAKACDVAAFGGLCGQQQVFGGGYGYGAQQFAAPLCGQSFGYQQQFFAQQHYVPQQFFVVQQHHHGFFGNRRFDFGRRFGRGRVNFGRGGFNGRGRGGFSLRF